MGAFPAQDFRARVVGRGKRTRPLALAGRLLARRLKFGLEDDRLGAHRTAGHPHHYQQQRGDAGPVEPSHAIVSTAKTQSSHQFRISRSCRGPNGATPRSPKQGATPLCSSMQERPLDDTGVAVNLLMAASLMVANLRHTVSVSSVGATTAEIEDAGTKTGQATCERIKSFCAAKPAQKLGWPTRARRFVGGRTYMEISGGRE